MANIYLNKTWTDWDAFNKDANKPKDAVWTKDAKNVYATMEELEADIVAGKVIAGSTVVFADKQDFTFAAGVNKSGVEKKDYGLYFTGTTALKGGDADADEIEDIKWVKIAAAEATSEPGDSVYDWVRLGDKGATTLTIESGSAFYFNTAAQGNDNGFKVAGKEEAKGRSAATLNIAEGAAFKTDHLYVAGTLNMAAGSYLEVADFDFGDEGVSDKAVLTATGTEEDAAEINFGTFDIATSASATAKAKGDITLDYTDLTVSGATTVGAEGSLTVKNSDVEATGLITVNGKMDIINSEIEGNITLSGTAEVRLDYNSYVDGTIALAADTTLKVNVNGFKGIRKIADSISGIINADTLEFTDQNVKSSTTNGLWVSTINAEAKGTYFLAAANADLGLTADNTAQTATGANSLQTLIDGTAKEITTVNVYVDAATIATDATDAKFTFTTDANFYGFKDDTVITKAVTFTATDKTISVSEDFEFGSVTVADKTNVKFDDAFIASLTLNKNAIATLIGDEADVTVTSADATSVLKLADGIEIEEGNLGSVAIQGAEEGAVATITEDVLNGNAISGLKVNFTGIDFEENANDVIEADISLDDIVSINGQKVKKAFDDYVVTVDGVTYDINQNNKQISFTKIDEAANAIDVPKDYAKKDGDVVVDGSDLSLKDVDITMQDGDTELKVKSGKKNAIVEFAVGNIGKNAGKGYNDVDLNKYTKVEIGGIDALRDFDLANRAEVIVTGAVDGIATEKKNIIDIGKNSKAQFADINLNGTKRNEIEIGSESKFTAANINGVKDIDVKSGDKEDFTAFTATSITTDAGEDAELDFGKYVNANVGNVTFNTGDDQIEVGKYSKFTANVIDFGAGIDDLDISKGAVVKVNNIKGLEVLEMSKGSELWLMADNVNDIDLTKMLGDWDDAAIMDYAGELTNAGHAGKVVEAEWETFSFSNAAAKKISFSSEDKLIVEYCIEGGEWQSVSDIKSINTVAMTNYFFRVALNEEFEDQNDQKDIAFNVTIA